MLSYIIPLALLCVLAVASYHDIKTQEIPLWLILATLGVGAANVVIQAVQRRAVPWELLAASFGVWLLMVILAIPRRGFGGADIWTYAGVGAVFGVFGTLLVTFVSVALNAIWLLCAALIRRKRSLLREPSSHIPFVFVACVCVTFLSVILQMGR